MQDRTNGARCRIGLLPSPALTERTLIIIAAIGAAFVAYAVYVLLERNPPVPATVDPPAKTRQAGDDRARAATRANPIPPIVLPKPVAKSKPTPGAPPPPLPTPEVSLEQAREDYDDYIAELRREIKRSKDTGKKLPTEGWVEYYGHGNEVMEPLRVLLDQYDEDDRAETEAKEAKIRDLLEYLQMNDVENIPDDLDAPL